MSTGGWKSESWAFQQKERLVHNFLLLPKIHNCSEIGIGVQHRGVFSPKTSYTILRLKLPILGQIFSNLPAQ